MKSATQGSHRRTVSFPMVSLHKLRLSESASVHEFRESHFGYA